MRQDATGVSEIEHRHNGFYSPVFGQPYYTGLSLCNQVASCGLKSA